MKFLLGNPGGPGRPKRAIEERYLRKLSSSVTMQDWSQIVGMAVFQAKNGDAVARRWLSEYLIGRPLSLREEVRTEEPVNITVSWRDIEGEQDCLINNKVINSTEIFGKGGED